METLGGRHEATKELFGRKNKLDIWAAIYARSDTAESPDLFAREDIRTTAEDKMERPIPVAQVAQEIELLTRLGMVEKVSDQAWGKDRAPAYYKRLESPGWKIVEAALCAFEIWFPEEQ